MYAPSIVPRKAKEMVITEAYSLLERVTMPISSDIKSPYFYFYLPFVMDMGVLFPFYLSPWRF